MSQLTEQQQEQLKRTRLRQLEVAVFPDTGRVVPEIGTRFVVTGITRNVLDFHDGPCTVVELSLLDSDSQPTVTVKPDVLNNWLKPICTRLMYGRCTTLYCLRRGGYIGEPADASIATCEAYESYNALSQQSDTETVGDAQRLAFAIESAAVKAGIIEARQHALTGPQLLMLCDDLANAATNAATAMRDKCVEKVEEMRAVIIKRTRDRDESNRLDSYRINLLDSVIAQLQSLTLDQVKQEKQNAAHLTQLEGERD